MAWNDGGFGGGTFGTSAEFNVTDQELMSLIQLCLLEPDTQGQTWASGVWSQQEILGYINDRTRRYLMETGLTQEISFINGQAGKSRYDIPQDVVDIRRLAWRRGDNGAKYKEMARLDSWELDNMVDQWPTAQDDVPTSYTDSYLPSLQIDVVPQPADIGQAIISFVALGPAVDGTGLKLGVPDEIVPGIKWGVLADMLSKQGEGSDPERAAYCESRFKEFILLGQILLGG